MTVSGGGVLCWGLGGFGVGLTGALKVNTKEDMAENSRMIVLRGANIASQPNTGRHIVSAWRRGAKVVTIDVRRTEAAAQSDEVLLIRPGSDAALALAVMHVIVTEKLYDAATFSLLTPLARRGRCPARLSACLPAGERPIKIYREMFTPSFSRSHSRSRSA